MKDFFKRLGVSREDIEQYNNNYEYMIEEFKEKYSLVSEYLLCKKKGDFDVKREELLSRLYYSQGLRKIRLKASEYDNFFASGYVRKIYNLSDIEWFILVIALMYQADERYKRAISEIEESKNLTYSTILKLYFFTDDITKIENYHDILYSCSKKMNSLCFMDGYPKVDERLFDNIMNNFNVDTNTLGFSFFNLDDNIPLLIREHIAIKISDYISNSDDSTANFICIYGEEGIGRHTMINRVCKIQDKGIVYINLGFSEESILNEIILQGCREALLKDSYICFFNFKSSINKSSEELSRLYFAIEIASKFSKVIFVISNDKINLSQKIDMMNCINIYLPELDISESIVLWKEYLKDVRKEKKLNITEFASKFIFNPQQIRNSVYDALNNNLLNKIDILSSSALSDSAYSQVTNNLSDKATIIRKKHTWDELVLNSKEKEILRQACNQIRYRYKVYNKWGMNKRILYGQGLSMLFSGASGTGKTMAAQVIANELELEIYKVDLSKVISKYIGESEKNLGEIFDSARKSNVILLFDETDAIFAKRTEVKDSHDRNANLETSYLLQKMEEHSGITIMTTNFLENIDKAFFRRINYVVHFTVPDVNARKEIWQKMYPKEMPLSKDIDFDFLSKNFEITGGSIKNIALNSAFMAASENKKVSMKHIVKALSQEIAKQGKMVSKNEFREYGYLL